MAAKVIAFPRVACNASTRPILANVPEYGTNGTNGDKPPSVLPEDVFPANMPKAERDKWQQLAALLDGWPPEDKEDFLRYMHRRIMMARNR